MCGQSSVGKVMPPPKRKMIVDAFFTIAWLSDGSQFEGQWICDESWLRILKRYFPLLKNEIDLCLSDVSRALATILIHGSNHSNTMIFQKTFSMNFHGLLVILDVSISSIEAQMEYLHLIYQIHWSATMRTESHCLQLIISQMLL